LPPRVIQTLEVHPCSRQLDDTDANEDHDNNTSDPVGVIPANSRILGENDDDFIKVSRKRRAAQLKAAAPRFNEPAKLIVRGGGPTRATPDD